LFVGHASRIDDEPFGKTIHDPYSNARCRHYVYKHPAADPNGSDGP